jgi:hypothetical protein
MAQGRASTNMYDFMYGKYLLKKRFGIVMHEDEYVEEAYGIYRDIGNIATATHAFRSTIDGSRTVTLPCNVEFIEAVSHGSTWNNEHNQTIILMDRLPNANPYSFIPNAIVRNDSLDYNESGHGQTRLHPNGQMIPVELQGVVGNMKLQFDEKEVGREGVCIYRGMCVDQNGNPLLSRKQADAIAWKLAYFDILLKSYQKDPGAMNMLQKAEMDAGRKMAAAKIPEYLTQNELNKFLSAKTRHDRKVWWSDYKTLQ